jgi:hypothetical protein
MGTVPSLAGCWDKLQRAEYHLEDLRNQVKQFEATHDYRYTVEVDAGAGKYSFYIHDLQPADAAWGLIIGDCVHNARCALDHLVGQLASLATGAEPGSLTRTAFPVYSDAEKFSEARARRLKGLRPGHQTVIEELQPFNARNVSIWGAGEGCTPSVLPALLQQLAILDDIDKHRVIHTVWNRMEITIPAPVLPHGFQLLAPARIVSPLQNDAYIGEWIFKTPLPSTDWRPGQTEMKRYFPIHVSLENTLIGIPVYDCLAHYIRAVRAVISIFEPVFSNGGSPLRPSDVMSF